MYMNNIYVKAICGRLRFVIEPQPCMPARQTEGEATAAFRPDLDLLAKLLSTRW